MFLSEHLWCEDFRFAYFTRSSRGLFEKTSTDKKLLRNIGLGGSDACNVRCFLPPSQSSQTDSGWFWGRSGEMGPYKDKKWQERVAGVPCRFKNIFLCNSILYHLPRWVSGAVSQIWRLLLQWASIGHFVFLFGTLRSILIEINELIIHKCLLGLRFIQVTAFWPGLSSRGKGCAYFNQPGIYTR